MQVCNIDAPALFFFLLGGGNDLINGDPGIIMLGVCVSIWGLIDTMASIFVTIHTSRQDENSNCCSPNVTTISIISLQVFFAVFEFVGIFFDLSVSKYFLLVWPISNAFRVIDAILSTVTRTKDDLFSHYEDEYKTCYLIFDILGTGVGFTSQGDPLWQKLITIGVEFDDAIFALLYSLHNWGSFLSWFMYDLMCFLKIAALSFKIPLAFKGFVSCGSKKVTAAAAILLGVVVFVTLLLVQLLSMNLIPNCGDRPLCFDDFAKEQECFPGVNINFPPCVKFITLVIPLISIIGVYAVVVFILAKTGVKESESDLDYYHLMTSCCGKEPISDNLS